MTDFKLALQGNYQKTLDSRTSAYLDGLKIGTKMSVDHTKLAIRRDVLQSGLGRRVANSVRGDVFPKRGRAYEPGGLVYSKTPKILVSQADGPTVRPEYSDFLAIPISGSPADGLRRRNGETLIEAFWRRYGNDSLRLIKTKKGQYQMVARLRNNTAGTRFTGVRPTRTKTGKYYTRLARIESVPVFTLVKQVRHKRRLDTRQIMAKASRRHPSRVAFHVRQQLARSMRETAVN